jgi:hypothetical protein
LNPSKFQQALDNEKADGANFFGAEALLQFSQGVDLGTHSNS